jgi:hypothetical protein
MCDGGCPNDGPPLGLLAPDEPGRPLPAEGGRLFPAEGGLPAEGGRLFPAEGGLPAEGGRLFPAEGGRLDGLGEVARPEADPTANTDAFSTIAVWDLVRPWKGKGVRDPLGSGGLSIGGGDAVVVDS